MVLRNLRISYRFTEPSCSICYTKVDEDTLVCPNCGAVLQEDVELDTIKLVSVEPWVHGSINFKRFEFVEYKRGIVTIKAHYYFVSVEEDGSIRNAQYSIDGLPLQYLSEEKARELLQLVK